MDAENIKALRQLYRRQGLYVTAFAIWRCWHTSYVLMENFIPKEGLIFDLGCGCGLFSNLLALTSDKRKIIGIDISKRKLNMANRGLPNVSFQHQDVMKFNWTNCQGIALIHLLHHLSSFGEQERLLNICYNSLQENGILLTIEIDKHPLWKFIFTKLVDILAYPGDKFYFRSSLEFTNIFNSIGFRNIKVIPIRKGVLFSQVLYVAQK